MHSCRGSQKHRKPQKVSDKLYSLQPQKRLREELKTQSHTVKEQTQRTPANMHNPGKLSHRVSSAPVWFTIRGKDKVKACSNWQGVEVLAAVTDREP